MEEQEEEQEDRRPTRNVGVGVGVGVRCSETTIISNKSRRACSLSRAINNDFVSSTTPQHKGSAKKMFKVLCQFRVLDEHKKNGGHFEPVRSSLPHT